MSPTNTKLLDLVSDNLNLYLVIVIIFLLIAGVRFISNSIKEAEKENKIISSLKMEGKNIYKGTLHFLNVDSLWNTEHNYVVGHFYEEDDRFVDIYGISYYKMALRKTELKVID